MRDLNHMMVIRRDVEQDQSVTTSIAPEIELWPSDVVMAKFKDAVKSDKVSIFRISVCTRGGCANHTPKGFAYCCEACGLVGEFMKKYGDTKFRIRLNRLPDLPAKRAYKLKVRKKHKRFR